jgi:hypothetical protein
MRRVLGIPRLVVTVAAIAIGVEAGYLVYPCVKHPYYFRAADAADAHGAATPASYPLETRDGHVLEVARAEDA